MTYIIWLPFWKKLSIMQLGIFFFFFFWLCFFSFFCRLPPVALDSVGSFLVELVLTLTSGETFRELYEELFQGRLLHFSVHPKANYVLQRLISSCKEKEMVGYCWATWMKFFSRQHMKYFSYFFQKTGFDISCKLSLTEMSYPVFWKK